MNKKLIIFIIVFFFHEAATASDCSADVIGELEGISYIELDSNLIQIDIKVPESINGEKITSAQILQSDPFIFMQVAFPWKVEGLLSTQMHFSSKIIINPEFQAFYGKGKCSVLLRKQLYITKPSN